jgi:hypothetical protein
LLAFLHERPDFTQNETAVSAIGRNTALRAAASFGLLMLLVVAGTVAFAAAQIFCCHDESGKQVCGDILPPACYGRAYRELGESGRTAKVVEAPLTAEQRAAACGRRTSGGRSRSASNEQKRKDQALLNTYGSEKDIEVMRSRTERDLDGDQGSEERIVEIRKHRKKFEDEAEFYRNGVTGGDGQGLARCGLRDQAQESVIDSKRKDQEAIRLKYDEDLRRFRDILTRAAATAAERGRC